MMGFFSNIFRPASNAPASALHPDAVRHLPHVPPPAPVRPTPRSSSCAPASTSNSPQVDLEPDDAQLRHEMRVAERQAGPLASQRYLTNQRILTAFFLELHLGKPHALWLPKAYQAARELASMAQAEDGNTALVLPLTLLAERLDRLSNMTRAFDANDHLQLLEDYARCSQIDESPFQLGALIQASRRELLRNLLDSMNELSPVARQRLRSQGLDTIEHIQRLDASELAKCSGLPTSDAEQLLRQLTSFLDVPNQDTLAWAEGKHEIVLSPKLQQLEVLDRDFAQACHTDDVLEKRQLRERRKKVASELNLWLAQFGQLDLIVELDRRSAKGKLHRLKQWMNGERNPETATISEARS